MKIGNFDTSKKVMLVAELSANHKQDLNLAKETIIAAKEAGADAVKLQTYTPDTITIDCKNKDFFIDRGTLWDGEYLYDLYKRAYTPWEWHEELFQLCKSLDIECFSAAFDNSAVDLLEKLNTPAHKVASFEITDIPLIEYMAKNKKPTIISTGISDLSDIELAVNSVKKYHNDIMLLKCTSSYPAPLNEVNLLNILSLRDIFGVEMGISDHTLGISISVASVALGARLIEKHFILDKNVKTPDSDFSIDFKEFKNMVESVREVEESLGTKEYKVTPKMKINKNGARSLYIVKDIPKDGIITEENVRSIRPGYGLHPKYLPQILGKRVNKDLKKGDRMELKYIKE
jgi:pseudaminic acid synthase